MHPTVRLHAQARYSKASLRTWPRRQPQLLSGKARRRWNWPTCEAALRDPPCWLPAPRQLHSPVWHPPARSKECVETEPLLDFLRATVDSAATAPPKPVRVATASSAVKKKQRLDADASADPLGAPRASTPAALLPEGHSLPDGASSSGEAGGASGRDATAAASSVLSASQPCAAASRLLDEDEDDYD